ncbi:MAG: AAA family ATPase [Chloroflexota bacterium]|nr:AAA family ATPase [Chloroflexota bacterium]
MVHLKKVTLYPEKYPTEGKYPFSLKILQKTQNMVFTGPVTFFVGENGTGKSTLLKAMCRKCGVYIWEADLLNRRFELNPYEERLFDFIDVEWTDGPVYGSFFSSQIFQDFVRFLDGSAAADPGILKYFGGKSLLTQSHGQSLISLFEARYRIKGIYFMDEPETALSPKNQLELLKMLKVFSQRGDAQFIIATQCPILMACPGATIFSFDYIPVKPVRYEETEHFQIYKDFMGHGHEHLSEL